MTRVIYHMIIDKIIKKKCEIEPRDTFKDILKFSINLSCYKKKKKKIIINLFRNSLKNIHSLRFKYFHKWTPSSSREEILKIAKNFVLSRQGQVSWLARRERGREREKSFLGFILNIFIHQTEVAYFCMNNWYPREDFWFQDQETCI